MRLDNVVYIVEEISVFYLGRVNLDFILVRKILYGVGVGLDSFVLFVLVAFLILGRCFF